MVRRAPSSALGTEHWMVSLIVTLGKGWGEVRRWETAAFFPANAQEDPRGTVNGARTSSTLVRQAGLIPNSAPHSLHKLSQYSWTRSFHFLTCKMTLNNNIYLISVMKIKRDDTCKAIPLCLLHVSSLFILTTVIRFWGPPSLVYL